MLSLLVFWKIKYKIILKGIPIAIYPYSSCVGVWIETLKKGEGKMKVTRICGHTQDVDDAIIDINGIEGYISACQDCRDTASLYADVYYAMAGNVYSLARVAAAGLITGLRPTISDLDRAGSTLYARLTPQYADIIHHV